jgi:putative AdoMet-dependent methyltransferase
MTDERRAQLFDDWALHYDRSIHAHAGFPFAGYDEVLAEVAWTAAAQCGMTVLDLGIGTGNLSTHLAALGCRIWGIDFSAEMLARAREKLPQAVLVQGDLLRSWPGALDRRFDRIVSAYVLHEFDLPTKIELLQRLARDHLAPGGCIVVGDIAFPTAAAHDHARTDWARLWDEDEHYWIAEETVVACRQAGLQVIYEQISICGGVFRLDPLGSEGRDGSI